MVSCFPASCMVFVFSYLASAASARIHRHSTYHTNAHLDRRTDPHGQRRHRILFETGDSPGVGSRGRRPRSWVGREKKCLRSNFAGCDNLTGFLIQWIQSKIEFYKSTEPSESGVGSENLSIYDPILYFPSSSFLFAIVNFYDILSPMYRFKSGFKTAAASQTTGACARRQSAAEYGRTEG